MTIEKLAPLAVKVACSDNTLQLLERAMKLYSHLNSLPARGGRLAYDHAGHIRAFDEVPVRSGRLMY